MSPGHRHVTKPVCDITSALRREGAEFSVSTLVLYSGSGVPDDIPAAGGATIGSFFTLNEKEIRQIEQHKVAILHHGNVRSHVAHKVRKILEQCDVAAVVVSQSPIDYEDFAKVGVKTAYVMPPAAQIRTKGTVMAIVSGVTRGLTPTRTNIAEVIQAVMKVMKQDRRK
jgi:methyl-coenzyme M reductase subunit C